MRLTNDQKRANEQYFKQVIELLKEGGIYTYPDKMEHFTKLNGKLHGTKKGVREIQKITPKSFHPFVVEKGEA